jgi:hypothetical protein
MGNKRSIRILGRRNAHQLLNKQNKGREQVLRKFMSVVALSSVPVLSFGIAQVATSGNAFAAGKSTTCTGGSQTVSFAAPGLSTSGSAQKSKNSTSMTSAATSSTCTGAKPGAGTVAANNIKTTSTTKCSTVKSNAPAACTGEPKWWVYDSASQFVAGSSTLYKAVPTTTFTDAGTTYTTANTKSAQATTCPSTEVGFKLTGALTAPASQKGKATTIIACLNTDTGTNTTGNFKSDITTEVLGGSPSMVIASAAFDPASSSITFK